MYLQRICKVHIHMYFQEDQASATICKPFLASLCLPLYLLKTFGRERLFAGEYDSQNKSCKLLFLALALVNTLFYQNKQVLNLIGRVFLKKSRSAEFEIEQVKTVQITKDCFTLFNTSPK